MLRLTVLQDPCLSHRQTRLQCFLGFFCLSGLVWCLYSSITCSFFVLLCLVIYTALTTKECWFLCIKIMQINNNKWKVNSLIMHSGWEMNSKAWGNLAELNQTDKKRKKLRKDTLLFFKDKEYNLFSIWRITGFSQGTCWLRHINVP